MYKRGKNIAMSDMYCVKCGGHMTVPRSRRQTREKSHLKDMYCPYCKVESKFREVREKDFILAHVI